MNITSSYDLLVLLGSEDSSSSKIICKIFLEAVKAEELPDIFHEIVVNFLTSRSRGKRFNGAHVLQLICRKYSSILSGLLTESKSDGELLSLNALNIPHILRCQNFLHGGAASNEFFDARHESILYETHWLKKQQACLRKKLGVETGSEEARMAIRFGADIEILLTEKDLKPASVSSRSRLRPLDIGVERFVDDEEESERLGLTRETWLARLVRSLVVGLLDAQWEVRQGSSMGLTSILQGLFSSVTDLTPNLSRMPAFLLRDIILCGLSVQVLDHFLDFHRDSNTASITPVKETIGQLVASALKCLEDEDMCRKAYELCCEMADASTLASSVSLSTAAYWTVQCGGLTTLKYLIAIFPAFIFEKGHVRFAKFTEILVSGLGDRSEEVVNATVQLLRSLDKALSNDICSSTLALILDTPGVLLESFLSPIAALDEFSSSALPLCTGLMTIAVTICRLSQWLKTFSNSLLMDLLILMLYRLKEISSKLCHVTSQKQKSLCTATLCSALQLINLVIRRRIYNIRHELSSKVREEWAMSCFRLAGTALSNLLVCPVLSVGDLHLVSKSEQQIVQTVNPTAATSNLSFERNKDDCVYKHHAISVSHLLNGLTADRNDLYTGFTCYKEVYCAFGATLRQICEMALTIHNKTALSSSDLTRNMSSLCASILSKQDRCDDNSGRKEDFVVKYSLLLDAFDSQIIQTAFELSSRLELHIGEVKSALQLPNPFQTCSESRLNMEISNALNYLWGQADRQTGEYVYHCLFGFCTLASDTREIVQSVFNQALHSLLDSLPPLSSSLSALKATPKPDGLPKLKFKFRFVKDTEPSVFSSGKDNTSLGCMSLEVESIGARVEWIVAFILRLAYSTDLIILSELETTKNAWNRFHDQRSVVSSTYRLSNRVTDLWLASAAAVGLDEFRHAWDSIIKAVPVEREELWYLSFKIAESISLRICNDFRRTSSEDRLWEHLHFLCDFHKRSECFHVSVEYAFRLIVQEFPFPIFSLWRRHRSLDDWIVFELVKHASEHSFQGFIAEDGNLDLIFSPWQSLIPQSDPFLLRQLARRFAAILSQIVLRLNASPSASAKADQLKLLLNCTYRIQTGLSRSIQIEQRRFHAVLFHALSQTLRMDLLCVFWSWLSIVVSGMNDFDEEVRSHCTQVFRLIVPLASLARESDAQIKNGSLPLSSSSSSNFRPLYLVGDLLDKSHLCSMLHSLEDVDVFIMNYFRMHTTLVSGVEEALREYQWDGITWLTQLRRCGLGGAIIADEMGLGKSVQALTFLAVLRIEEHFYQKEATEESFLIVSPASLTRHWEEEIRKFFPESVLRPIKYPLPEEDKPNMTRDLIGSSKVVIVSYDMLRRDKDKYFKHRIWKVVVLDEAHLIKNPETATAQAVFSLKSNYRIGLTGTPVQNKVDDLWSLMNFLMPDYLGDYSAFCLSTVRPILRSFSTQSKLKCNSNPLRQHEATDLEKDGDLPGQKRKREEGKEKGGRSCDLSFSHFNQSIEISIEGLNALRDLHKQVLPFILRRTKDSVLTELPPKSVIDVMCPLSAVQKEMYSTFQCGQNLSDENLETELSNLRDANGVEKRETGEKRTRANPLKALMYLKLLCVHPALVVESQHTHYRSRLCREIGSSGKILKLVLLLLESEVMLPEDYCSVEERKSKQKRKGLRGDVAAAASAVTESLDELYAKEQELESLSSGVEQFVESGEVGMAFSAELGDENSSADSREEEEEEDEVDKEDIKTAEQIIFTRSRNKRDEMSEHDSDEELSDNHKVSAAPIPKHFSNDEVKKKPRQKNLHSPCQNLTHEKLSRKSSFITPIVAHRCLIFAHHHSVLSLVEECVLKRYFPSVRYERLDGSVLPARRAQIAYRFNIQNSQGGKTSEKQKTFAATDFNRREKEIDVSFLHSTFPGVVTKAPETTEWESGNDIRLLLMTTRACGLGLNLTAADTVIFLEHDWNPFVDMQAMDRVHRLGQTRPVTIFRLLARSSIEARILGLQDIKKSVASELVNEENCGMSSGKDGGKLKARGFGDMLCDSLTVYSGTSSEKMKRKATSDDNLDENLNDNFNLDSFIQSFR